MSILSTNIFIIVPGTYKCTDTLTHNKDSPLSMTSQRRKSSLFYRRKWQLHETKKLAHSHMVEKEF